MSAQPQREPIEKRFDAVVVGGGLAGISAAVEAARAGHKVCLVQDRPVLGGVSSSEMGMHVSGAEGGGFRYARTTGLVEELHLTERYRNPIPYGEAEVTPVWDIVLFEAVKEAGVDLLLNCTCTDVVMDGCDIKGVLCVQAGAEKQFLLYGKYFVDATGDGSVGYWAGAEWRYGREGKDEFGESLAPDEPDDKVLASTLLFRTRDMGRPVQFVPPPWAKVYPNEESLAYRDHKDPTKGYWWIEYGGTIDTIGDNQHIYEELLKRLFGVLDHIKNRGDHGADNLAIQWISSVPGKRESRRLVGHYMMHQKDVQEGTLFPDRVGFGGWPMDFHLSEGIDRPDPPAINWFLQQPYSIPLRSLISKNVGNLFMAGRDVSVTHVALMSTRVMGTCATMGQAVGAAISACLRHDKRPAEIVKDHVEEVQQTILRRDGYIIGVRNQDPKDLALKAKRISVSSESSLAILHADEWHPLDTDRSQIVPVGPHGCTSVRLFLRNRTECAQEVQLRYGPAKTIWDFEGPAVNTVSVRLAPRDTVWAEFPLGDRPLGEGLARFTLSACEGVYWGYTRREVLGTSATFRNPHYPEPEMEGRGVWNAFPKWRYLRGSYCMDFTPENKPYGAANLISGVTRPEAAANIWISDPRAPLPQYIELEFDQPKTIRCVHLTFDTNLTPRANDLQVPMPETVKDYIIQYVAGGRWTECLTVTGNYLRKRVHVFSPVTTDRLRVTILSTNGSPTARVYEIRVYEEEIY